MVTCEVCGSENFEKHAGFMYCAVCQTQSQDYFEQEYEYQDHQMNTIRQKKSKPLLLKTKKQIFYDDGLWTSWEGFNFILYGMLNELTKCGANEEFKNVAFKLWAAYLKECRVAFTSKFEEKIPKLKFKFKERDARILYNTDVPLNASRKRKHESRSSKISNTSALQQSKRSLILQRRKIIAVDYQDHLSLSMQNNSTLADETLESLGKSLDLETNEECLNDSENLTDSFKNIFNKKDFRLYKSSVKLQAKIKNGYINDITNLGKNRLLSIIHLALLMTGSQIQLSDLVRFIRESHLSFAKVTHFFPNNMKFPKKGISYMEVISDSLMPTHLHQRYIVMQLARLLKIEKIPAPNTCLLIDRYCRDLNLPKQIAEFGKKILEDCFPSAVLTTKKLLPGFEARAMVSIIFVMKLLLGLNDRTEIFLSHLASEINSSRSSHLFVFKDWQNFIECRKTVLTNFHYPTQEQLNNNCDKSSKDFLDVLMKESKDEFRKDRFIPYPKYYMNRDLLNGIKETLGALRKPHNVASIDFQPSLTPQTSHVEAIIQDLMKPFEFLQSTVKRKCVRRREAWALLHCGISNLSERKNRETKGEDADQEPSVALPEKILKQSFQDCDLQFTFDPKSYLNSLGEKPDFFAKFSNAHNFSRNKSFQKDKTDSDFLFDCSSRYWIFHYPDSKSALLCNFKEEILEKTPENFQWLLRECARMLEMNVRDVYGELLRLEKKLRPGNPKGETLPVAE